MKKLIMIKYGELTTKKGNCNFFIKTLKDNIKEKLKNKDIDIYSDPSRMYIEFSEVNEEEILDVMSRIFGIFEYIIVNKVESNKETISKKVLELCGAEEFATFKVVTKRSDKSFPISSMDFSAWLGGCILKNFDTKVDVNNPHLTVYVEIRKDFSYVYTRPIKALGGYPVGVQGKALLMLSGGIDSPVAGYLALKRGIKLEAIYFESLPHTSLQAREKVLELARKLSRYSSDIKLHVVSFTELQEAIYSKIEAEYGVTIMRRMMYRIAAILAGKRKANAIITGESVGQVASQTLISMKVINAVTNYPIIRPVACLDKLEIIDIARKIDSYETSIIPYDDCCSLFLPKHPVINPDLKKCEEFEKLIDYENMIYRAVKDIKTISVCEAKESFGDLL